MTAPILECSSPNFNARRGGIAPDMVILHYTGMTSATAAIERLCDSSAQVSSHYLIGRDGICVRMVPEAARAWHAGASSWRGDTDINSRSIGIELVNPGHAHGYIDFPEAQMAALLRLLADIHARQAIAPGLVLGHSDIAPDRKQDPGERFDWPRLAAAGFGLWVPPAPVAAGELLMRRSSGPKVRSLQKQLIAIGFGLVQTGEFDLATEQAVTAFQRHWRPETIDGRADISTLKTLARLRALGGMGAA